MRKELTAGQIKALNFVSRVLGDPSLTNGNGGLVVELNKESLINEFGLSPNELEMIVLILKGISQSARDPSLGGPGSKFRRQLGGKLVNEPAGSRQQKEEEWGKIHIPKGHFRTGRNTSGRRRAVK